MMSIEMKRGVLPENGWSNPGHYFDQGFKEWSSSDDKRGEDIGDHINSVCNIPVPKIYKHAYKRWLSLTSDTTRFSSWLGTLQNRLFIGLGMPHVLESQVVRNGTYGMPYIPGSSLKGLARAMANKEGSGLDSDVINVLFGNDTNIPEESDAGYLIFHDAWWVPDDKKPYTSEVVTVHAVKYYKSKGLSAPHPDMESPNPNHQIAVQGRFYFVIEGKGSWADLGMRFLIEALKNEGIGGKTSVGYGYLKNNSNLREQDQRYIEKQTKTANERRSKLRALLEIDIKKDTKEAETSRMNEYELAVSELQELLLRYKSQIVISQEDKQKINQTVNSIIKKSDKKWPREERIKAAEVIKAAYNISIAKNKLAKKKENIDRWVSTDE